MKHNTEKKENEKEDEKSNLASKIFKILTFLLSMATAIVSALISVGYVLSRIASALGLMLGIVMATSNLIITTIFFFNTLIGDKFPIKHNVLANISLFITIPSLILSTASAIFSGYSSVMLLGAALALPAAVSPIVLGVAISFAALTGISCLLYNSMQVHGFWKNLSQPIKENISEKDNKNLQQDTLQEKHGISKKMKPINVKKPNPVIVKSIYYHCTNSHCFFNNPANNSIHRKNLQRDEAALHTKAVNKRRPR